MYEVCTRYLRCVGSCPLARYLPELRASPCAQLHVGVGALCMKCACASQVHRWLLYVESWSEGNGVGGRAGALGGQVSLGKKLIDP